MAFDWINKYLEVAKKYSNFVISGNDLEYSSDMCSAYKTDNFAYLPNLYHADWSYKTLKQIEKSHIDIGCFGAIRPSGIDRPHHDQGARYLQKGQDLHR